MGYTLAEYVELDKGIVMIASLTVNHWRQGLKVRNVLLPGQFGSDLQSAYGRGSGRCTLLGCSILAPAYDVLDGKWKRLDATGEFVLEKEDEVITQDMEDILWQTGLLDDMQFTSDISGRDGLPSCEEEHRRLRH